MSNITVIIPFFNEEETLRTTMESLCTQKHKPFKGERLHGFNKNAIFEESLLLKKKYFNKENFRFLHLCFMNRSSMNKNKFMITSRRPSRWWNRRNDKYIDYKIGQEVKVQISNFF